MESADYVALAVAATSDEATKKRMQELLAEHARIEAREVEVKAREAAVTERERDQQNRLAEAHGIVEGAEARHREMDGRQEKLAAMSDELNAQIATFESGRAVVHQQHKDKHDELVAREAHVIHREEAALRLGEHLSQRAQAVSEMERQHRIARDHAQSFIAALGS